MGIAAALDAAAGSRRAGCGPGGLRPRILPVHRAGRGSGQQAAGGGGAPPQRCPGLRARGELEDALAEIERLAAHPRIRAIGETGLDFFRTEGEGLAHQRYSFRRHIDIAKRLDLTLQIHDRDAHDDVVQVLREEGAPERVVFHCFSGDEELARICNAEGWNMSFAGTLTFKNARNLRAALAVADPDWCWWKPTRPS